MALATTTMEGEPAAYPEAFEGVAGLEGLAANNGGRVLWRILGGRERAAWRRASRCCRDNVDELVTSIQKLQLDLDDQDFACVEGLLKRAPYVARVAVQLREEGYRQLEQLLQEGCFPGALEQLSLMGSKNREMWWLPDAQFGYLLSSGLPSLVHLELSQVCIPQGFISSLGACSNLRSLRVDRANTYSPDTEDYVTPSAGREMWWSEDIAAELSCLTQLTRLEDRCVSDHLPLDKIQGLTGLVHLVVDATGAYEDSWELHEVQALTSLTGLEHLELRGSPSHWERIRPEKLVEVLQNLPSLHTLVVCGMSLDELSAAKLGQLSGLTSLDFDHCSPSCKLSFPSLKRLVLRTSLNLPSLHSVLQSSTQLQELQLDCCSIQQVNGGTLLQLVAVAERCAAMGGMPTLRVSSNLQPQQHSQLMSALHPLTTLDHPALHFQPGTYTLAPTAGSSLVAAIPNLHTLAGAHVDPSALKALQAFSNLQCLTLCSSLTLAALQAMSSLQLTELQAVYPEAGMHLKPTVAEPGAQRPLLPSLKVLILAEHSSFLTDVYYLLQTAPKLIKFDIDGLLQEVAMPSILMSAPESQPEDVTAQMLFQVMTYLSQPFMRQNIWYGCPCIAMDFCRHNYQDLPALLLSMSPLQRVEGANVELRGLARLDPPAAAALATVVPWEANLCLNDSHLDKAAMFLLGRELKTKHLRRLEITHCSGLTTMAVMFLQALLPKTEFMVASCAGVASDYHTPSPRQVAEDVALFEQIRNF